MIIKRNKHIVIAFILFLGLVTFSWGQTVVIPDTKLRSCLKNNYPSLLNASDELIIAQANSFSDILKCTGEKIVNVDGLQYFTSISVLNLFDNDVVDITILNGLTQLTEINLNSNDLEFVPDLTGFNSLKVFRANFNQLDNSPKFPISISELYMGNNSLSDTIDLTGLTGLKILELFENDIKGLKAWETLTEIEQLDLHTNDLAIHPDLSAAINLEVIDLSDNRFQKLPLVDLDGVTLFKAGYNKLTFEDIEPLTESIVFPSGFPDIFEQAMPVTPLIDSTTENEYWDWVLSFDKSLTSNIYYWFKGGIAYDTTTLGTLDINSLSLSDAGVYHCEIVNTNPKLSGYRIITNTRTVIVSPQILPNCFTVSNTLISNNKLSCSEVAFITVDISTQGAIEGDLRLLIDNEDTVSTMDFQLKNEGVFDLKVIDDVCTVETGKTIEIEFDLSNCEPPSFSPNGDGLEDEFYLKEEGISKVYSKTGELLKTIKTPALWDGTDETGNLLPLGHYIIVTDDEVSIGITLVR